MMQPGKTYIKILFKHFFNSFNMLQKYLRACCLQNEIPDVSKKYTKLIKHNLKLTTLVNTM